MFNNIDGCKHKIILLLAVVFHFLDWSLYETHQAFTVFCYILRPHDCLCLTYLVLKILISYDCHCSIIKCFESVRENSSLRITLMLHGFLQEVMANNCCKCQLFYIVTLTGLNKEHINEDIKEICIFKKHQSLHNTKYRGLSILRFLLQFL